MRTIIILAAAVILMAASVRAGIIHVPAEQPTIQAGINAAVDGDVVLVADGTYYENINFKGKAITVASHFLTDDDTTHINNTIIDGSKPVHPDSGSVVYFVSGEDTTSVLCGFTITGGTGTEITYELDGAQYSGRAGGGILCNNGFARIIHNKIINNSVISNDKEVFGGGITAIPYGSDAWIIIQENHFSFNSLQTHNNAAAGGGLEIGCNVNMVGNVISHNTIVFYSNNNNTVGAGFDLSTYSPDLRTAIVHSNQIVYNSITSHDALAGYPAALGAGVTIWGNYQGRLSQNDIIHNTLWVPADRNACGAGMLIGEVTKSFVIEGNRIKNNEVTNGTGWGGGANFASISAPIVLNNIIVGNSATNGGGFLLTNQNASHFINNTIINNQATEGGGMVIANSSTPFLLNNIIWGNQASSDPAINIRDSDVQAAYCDIQGGWSGVGNINVDPLFADADFRLADNSPCLNAGIAMHDFGDGIICCCPATDQCGGMRPNPTGSQPDMGAMESPSGVIDAVQIVHEIPNSHYLAQNYPNPFNSSTTIEFALPNASYVTLILYNLQGEQVAVLLAEERQAGVHQITWNAGNFASGVYFYKLETGYPSRSAGQGFEQVKKLILMK